MVASNQTSASSPRLTSLSAERRVDDLALVAGDLAGARVLGELGELGGLDGRVGADLEVGIELRPHRLDDIDLGRERGPARADIVADELRVLEALGADAGDHVAREAPRACPGASGSAISPIGSLSRSPSTLAGRKFIAGEPMKPATKRFAGSL